MYIYKDIISHNSVLCKLSNYSLSESNYSSNIQYEQVCQNGSHQSVITNCDIALGKMSTEVVSCAIKFYALQLKTCTDTSQAVGHAQETLRDRYMAHPKSHSITSSQVYTGVDRID